MVFGGTLQSEGLAVKTLDTGVTPPVKSDESHGFDMASAVALVEVLRQRLGSVGTTVLRVMHAACHDIGGRAERADQMGPCAPEWWSQHTLCWEPHPGPSRVTTHLGVLCAANKSFPGLRSLLPTWPCVKDPQTGTLACVTSAKLPPPQLPVPKAVAEELKRVRLYLRSLVTLRCWT